MKTLFVTMAVVMSMVTWVIYSLLPNLAALTNAVAGK